MTHRPCGACGALVPADTGCYHWQPGRSAKAADSATRRRVRREEREAAEPNVQPRRRVRTQEYRDKENERRRNRYAAEKASAPPRVHRQLASDAERVAEFARIMGRTYR